MTTAIRSLPLSDQAGFPAIFGAWLRGEGGDLMPAAAEAWTGFLTGSPSGDGPPPIWNDDGWTGPWWEDLSAAMPDEASRAAARANLGRLRRGEAEIVITGQQPGFLGGPLYSIYKAAAAVAAARMRTEAGLPTVPVYWFGDDDDDRREAFGARIFDFRRGCFLKARMPEGAADQMVGAASSARWARGGAAWLAENAGRGPLAADLSRLWTDAVAGGVPWGCLQRAALLRIFRGSGLLAVSGDDSRLHARAASLYREYLDRRAEMARAASQRGRELEAAGWHAQISDESLARPVHLKNGGRRLRLGDADLEDAASLPPENLRPGVVLRSLVQDRLFRPAGVVVGPGELAYLEQLRPVHAALGLPRAPLLPRLFARLTVDPERDAALADLESVDPAAATEAVSVAMGKALAAALAAEAGMPGDDAVAESRRLIRDWRPRLRDALIRRRRAERRSALLAAGPWEAIPGGRQERTLAAGWAAAVWGDAWVDMVLTAASAHFRSGNDAAWDDHLLTVAPPAGIMEAS